MFCLEIKVVIIRIRRKTNFFYLGGLTLGGYRLVYASEPTSFLRDQEKRSGETNFNYSLGMSVGKNGHVSSVTWDGPAFKQGLTTAAELLAVNGRAYSDEALRDAIAATQDAAAKRDDAKATGAPDAPKSDKATTDAAVAHKREVGELQGTMAELQNELDRTKKALFSAEAENANRRGKRSRPEVMRGTTIRKETPLGVMFVNITEDEKGQPFEVFLNLGKAGGSAMADAEAIGRLVSLALRSGISLPEIHRQLRGISSDRAVGLGPNKVLSLPDAVGIALEQWWRDKQGVQTDLLAGGAPTGMPTPVSSMMPPMLTPAAGVPLTRPPMTNGAEQMQPIEFGSGGGEVFMGTCPDCGSQLEFAEGCVKCHVCGFSECG